MKIENDDLLVNVDSMGARLTQIIDKKHQIDYLWSGDSTYWGRQAPVLFPIIGALIDDTYIYDEKAYQLTKHGFLRDTVMDLSLFKRDQIAYHFHNYKSINPHYPFDCDVTVSYQLNGNSLSNTYTVENSGKSNLYYNIGGHPGFTTEGDVDIKLHPQGEVNRFYLAGATVSDKQPTNQLAYRLTDDMLVNDALIYDGVSSVEVTSGKRRIFVDVSEFDYVGIWSPIQASSHTMAPFVCVEPWQGLPDFKDHNQELSQKQGIQVLAPKEKRSHSFTMTFNYDNYI